MTDFFKEIIIEVLKGELIEISFPNLKYNATEIAELESFNTLQKIKAIIEDDSLSDFDCVEEIVYLLGKMGSNGGNRHDFG